MDAFRLPCSLVPVQQLDGADCVTDLSDWVIRALSVRLPPRTRRPPFVLVRIAVGPLVLELSVSRLRKFGLVVRSPVSEGGRRRS